MTIKQKTSAKKSAGKKHSGRDAYVDVNKELYFGLIKCFYELMKTYDKYGNDGSYFGSEGLQQVLNHKDNDFDNDLITSQKKAGTPGPIERGNENWKELVLNSFVKDNRYNNSDAIAFRLLDDELDKRVVMSVKRVYNEIADDDDDFEDSFDILFILRSNEFAVEFKALTGLVIYRETLNNIEIYKNVKLGNYQLDDFSILVQDTVDKLKNLGG